MSIMPMWPCLLRPHLCAKRAIFCAQAYQNANLVPSCTNWGLPLLYATCSRRQCARYDCTRAYDSGSCAFFLLLDLNPPQHMQKGTHTQEKRMGRKHNIDHSKLQILQHSRILHAACGSFALQWTAMHQPTLRRQMTRRRKDWQTAFPETDC